MNVVVIDSTNIAGDADFPALNLQKYGWEQYPEIAPDKMEVHCWRSEVLISAEQTVDRAVLDKAYKVKLVVAAGDSTDHIDLEAAKERGITVCNVPGKDPANAADADRICRVVVMNINDYIKDEPRNVVV